MAASNYSGDTVRGPRTIVAKNLNVLRYDYKFNSAVSFSQAPDLWSNVLGVNAQSAPSTATPPETQPTKPPQQPIPQPKPGGAQRRFVQGKGAAEQEAYNKRDSKLSIAGATILGAQGWYDNVIWAGDPTNSDFLIAGGINLWRSTDGGLSLTDISNWRNRGSVHSDHHVIVAHPGYNGTTKKNVFFGNDGGIYKTSDVSTVGADPERTSGWESLNATYATTQFYGGAGNPSTGVITAGAQDNGTLQLLKDARENGWKVINDGDGRWCFAHPTLSDVFLGEYVDLDLFRSRVGGSEPEELSGIVRWREDGKADWKPDPFTIPDAKAAINDNAPTANFIPPFVIDSQNPKRLFAGGASLWGTEDADATVDDSTGASWQSVKDPITSDDPQGALISAVAVMPGNSDAVWVGHNNGRIFRTSNATSKDPRGTWKEIDAGTPRHLPTGRMCTRIVFDPKDPDVVYVTFGGYEKDNIWKIQIQTGGTKYTSIHGNLPAVPIFALTIHPKDARILYIGSENGVFSSANGGSSWSPVNSGPFAWVRRTPAGEPLTLTFYLKCLYDSPRMSTREERDRIELLQGTLDLLILRTLLLGPTHGHAIAKAIERNSDDVLQVEQGSLYPALHRLIKRGWISAEAGTSENNRRAKYYRLTAKGRSQLNIETTKWDKLTGAIARILRPAEQEGKP